MQNLIRDEFQKVGIQPTCEWFVPLLRTVSHFARDPRGLTLCRVFTLFPWIKKLTISGFTVFDVRILTSLLILESVVVASRLTI